jgi:hypothetical protein
VDVYFVFVSHPFCPHPLTHPHPHTLVNNISGFVDSLELSAELELVSIEKISLSYIGKD